LAHSFDSESRAVGAMLGSLERRVIAVPRFQRGYSWEKQHVATFWSDLTAFVEDYEKAPKSASYFFGPIVVQKQPEEIQLLDGQQRLATATILLAAIRDVARTLQFAKGHPQHDLAYEIQSNLIQKEDSDPPYALRLGELDAEYFRKTVQIDPPESIEPDLRSHELIRSAYKTLREEVEKVTASIDPDEAIKKLKMLKDAVAKGLLVVAINVESEDDAYSIFETLNDRGLRLSVPDLLLNLLMRRAQSDVERNQVRKEWNYMLEQLGRRDIARFLRHMWLSRYGDLKARSLFNELKDHLSKNKATGKVTSVQFTEACAIDCDYYVAIIDQTKDVPKAARNDVTGVIKYLGVTSSLPLLLAGLQALSAADFARLARMIAVLAVRYSVVSDLNPSTLESAFYQAARDIRTGETGKEPSAKILAGVQNSLSKLNPSDAIVKEKANDMVLDRAPALWILTQMANHLQSQTRELAVSEANLEHIFPRNGTVTQWPNKADLEPYLWVLGNLTILGEEFNRSASNKSYATKAANYYKNSEIVMTNALPGKYSAWTPTEVTVRTIDMSNVLVNAFQL
jgi:hypothetical protein